MINRIIWRTKIRPFDDEDQDLNDRWDGLELGQSSIPEPISEMAVFWSFSGE